MGLTTGISWTDSTWSPLRAKIKPDALEIATRKGYASLVQILTATKPNGELRSPPGKVGHHCEHASDGCKNCYSETNNGRCLPANGTGLPFDRRSRDLTDMFLDEKILQWPLKWKKGRRIFVESQSDLFGEFVPDELVDRVFAVMCRCVQGHTFQLLTKRAGRMREYMMGAMPRVTKLLEADLGEFPDGIVWPPRHVHLGVSVEDQQRADERIPLLLQTPATVRWVSYEPALGPVNFNGFLGAYSKSPCGEHARFELECVKCAMQPVKTWPKLDWGVHGGESGTGARPNDIEWARSFVAQFAAAMVPAFVKQLGARPLDGRKDCPRCKGFAVLADDTDCPRQCGSNGTVERPLKLKNRSGADMEEWPADLRVRQFPETPAAPQTYNEVGTEA